MKEELVSLIKKIIYRSCLLSTVLCSALFFFSHLSSFYFAYNIYLIFFSIYLSIGLLSVIGSLFWFFKDRKKILLIIFRDFIVGLLSVIASLFCFFKGRKKILLILLIVPVMIFCYFSYSKKMQQDQLESDIENYKFMIRLIEHSKPDCYPRCDYGVLLSPDKIERIEKLKKAILILEKELKIE